MTSNARLARKWPLALAGAFLALVATLSWNLYSTESQLRVATDTRLVADSQRRAATVEDFVAERGKDAVQLAASHEIEDYLTNRALGMSPRYGLSANLDAIEALFRRAIQQQTLRGAALDNRIALYGADGELIVAAGVDGDAPQRAVDPSTEIDAANWTIVSSAPVRFKDQYSGKVVVTTDLQLLSRLLIVAPTEPGKSVGRYREFVLVDQGRRILSADPSEVVSGTLGAALARLPENRLVATAGLHDIAELGAMIALRTSIRGAPLSVVTLTSEADAYGGLGSSAFTVAAGVIPAAMFLMALGLGWLRRRNMRLQNDHSDLTERNLALSEEISRLAYYDQLTGLPNRALLLERARQTMKANKRNGGHGALLFIDLDNFKTLNDTLGHDKGDSLLKAVAQRLSVCLRSTDTVARFGGDEFVVLLGNPAMRSEDDAASVAVTVGEKILAAFTEPFQLDGFTYPCTASLGGALFSEESQNFDDLLKRADLAMYEAKGAGRNRLALFDPVMQIAVETRASLEADLREDIKNKNLLLHYQPQIDLQGRLIGAEALVRWRHPRHDMVPPSKFIPVAESSGLILPLGSFVLRAACEKLAAWAGHPETARLTVAVNVSALQLHHHSFVDQVKDALKRTGADPRLLKLELTESIGVGKIEDVIEKMNVLQTLGVAFSIDDFGTGYSSLSYLKRLPLEQLKIDQGFVRDILSDPDDAAIAKMIIALAKTLGLSVIAEGVEMEAQRTFLEQLGCHAYQGYLFGRPMRAQQFEALAISFARDSPGGSGTPTANAA